MVDMQLKMGLRQLAAEGWASRIITDGFVDGLVGMESDPPSIEINDRFLSRFRTRIEDAAMRHARNQSRSRNAGKIDTHPETHLLWDEE